MVRRQGPFGMCATCRSMSTEVNIVLLPAKTNTVRDEMQWLISRSRCRRPGHIQQYRSPTLWHYSGMLLSMLLLPQLSPTRAERRAVTFARLRSRRRKTRPRISSTGGCPPRRMPRQLLPASVHPGTWVSLPTCCFNRMRELSCDLNCGTSELTINATTCHWQAAGLRTPRSYQPLLLSLHEAVPLHAQPEQHLQGLQPLAALRDWPACCESSRQRHDRQQSASAAATGEACSTSTMAALSACVRGSHTGYAASKQARQQSRTHAQLLGSTACLGRQMRGKGRTMHCDGLRSCRRPQLADQLCQVCWVLRPPQYCNVTLAARNPHHAGHLQVAALLRELL